LCSDTYEDATESVEPVLLVEQVDEPVGEDDDEEPVEEEPTVVDPVPLSEEDDTEAEDDGDSESTD
jgi:hypothetical protein